MTRKRGKIMPAKTPATTGLAETRPYDRFVEYVQQRAQMESSGDELSEELTAEAVEAITSATTEDELWNAMKLAGLTGLRDLDNGQIFIINSFRFAPGNLGIKAYAVIEATDAETGTKMMLDTGVPRILGFLRMCEQLGLFPVTVSLYKKVLESGNTLLTLSRVPGRVPVKSTAE